ncbi:MFS transporter [Enterococcus ratti]|uniref:MFS transporter n=1 Tax=Enterococcus ratti TaxID=150033 RepID=UPI0035129F36
MIKKNILSLLIFSQLFSVIGTVTIQFTLSLYLLDVTYSIFVFSIITSLSIIGRLFMLPFCGILTDRMNKRLLMVIMDTLYLIITLIMFITFITTKNVIPIGILVCLMGMVSAFETPIVQATIPLICDKNKLPKVNSIVDGIGILGNMFGPLLAGSMYSQKTLPFIFIFCVLLFSMAMILQMIMRFDEQPTAKKFVSVFQTIKEDTHEVLHYLKKNQLFLKICLLAFFLNFFLTSFIQIVIPYLARVWFAASNEQYSIMNFLFSLGGLIGTITYGILAKKITLSHIPQQLTLISCIFLLLVFPIHLLPVTKTAFWTMTGIVTVFLAFVSLISIELVVFIQLTAEQKLLGRLMSFIMVICTFALPPGQILFGWISSISTNLQLTYLVGGISLCTLFVAFLSKKQLKSHFT